MVTTTELTIQYIKDHPDIKRCLKKDLINYSSLARTISKELNITKKSSKEAILIAARRYRETLKKELNNEIKIKDLIKSSTLEIKNKIAVITLNKTINIEKLMQLKQTIAIPSMTWYLIEGSNNHTLITNEHYVAKITQKFKNNTIKTRKNQALVTLMSQKSIEDTPGVISYLTSRFHEYGINITELLSCWTDTLFVIHSKNTQKVLEFL